MTDAVIKDPYRNFIATSKYARWRDDLGRREYWGETVDRYIDYMTTTLERDHGYVAPPADVEKVRSLILDHSVMPSMRALMTAGPALERSHIAGYNCSYLPVDSPRSFDEAMYILMNGTGVGFSVEQSNVSKLPDVPEVFSNTNTVIQVVDSREGWAKAFRELLALLWAGRIPTWNLSAVRPAGARLKTFGGRASGPGPLDNLFRFTVDMFTNAAGRKLRPVEAHDLMCKIGDVVVAGSVRRSALISLTDLGDYNMATAKAGAWYEKYPHRRLANNSAVYPEKPSVGEFMAEWLNLYNSKSGERGLFNRQAVKRQVEKSGRRSTDHTFGTNPCSEIILRPYQFCNLSEVVIREEDTVDDLTEKVEAAAILGTWQSAMTTFKYLRKIWKTNTEEERLLGVSLTGQLGHPLMSGQKGLAQLAEVLESLRETAVATNARLAADMGIPASAAVTCVKPSGTVSQLTGVSSGMHPWYSQYYARTVRANDNDPLTTFLKDSGIYCEQDLMSDDTSVFYFPVKAPEGALTRRDLTAIEHLELWLTYKNAWCEHNPSITINVKEDEWFDVGSWVWEHFDEVCGVSFLPFDDHTYKQAPYQELSEAEYSDLVSKTPVIDWRFLAAYETEDGTAGSRELACSADLGCEVVDVVK